MAEELLRACDDQVFVLDHCGVPNIAGGGFAPWAASLRRLAAYPNLTCKLSGITAYCAQGHTSSADLAPWVAHVLDCFGPARIVWGSYWPVANLGVGLPKWIDQTRALLAQLGTDEAAAIAQRNARRFTVFDIWSRRLCQCLATQDGAMPPVPKSHDQSKVPRWRA